MMFMQVPNGIMNLKNEFAPKDEGAITNMPRTLEPMAAFKDNLVIPTNLDQNQRRSGLRNRRPTIRALPRRGSRERMRR